jgi:hypothetical protein
VGLQPGKKVVVLRSEKIAREGLIEVMVGIDETRQNDLPGKVNHCVGRGRKFFVRTNVFDETVPGVKPGVFHFPVLAVHCDQDFGILGEECGHMINLALGGAPFIPSNKGATIGFFLGSQSTIFVQIAELLLYHFRSLTIPFSKPTSAAQH